MTNTTIAPVADRQVRQVMSRPVIAVRDVDTLDRGLQVLAIADLHHVAVVDAEGRYAGLLSDRTIAAAWLHYPMEFSRLRAADVVDVAGQPVVAGTATVREAAFAMHAGGTDAVVALDGDRRPVGVLTAADLVALLAAAD
jgi:CBS domain-containing protein